MLLRLLGAPEKTAAKFVLASGLSVAAAVIINTQIGLYFGALFVLLALVLMTRGNRRNAIVCGGLAAWVGAVVAGILVLNYVTAGLPIDQGITWLWPFADVEKLYTLGSLPMVIGLYWGTKGLIAQGIPFFSLRTYKFVVQSFRLDVLYPLIIPASWHRLCIDFYPKKWAQRDAPRFARPVLHFHAFTIVTVCALVCLIVCLTVGRTQPVSFHRYSTFAVPITLLMGVILWSMPIPDLKNRIVRLIESNWTPLVIVGCCLFVTITDTRLYRHRDLLTTPLSYAAGVGKH